MAQKVSIYATDDESAKISIPLCSARAEHSESHPTSFFLPALDRREGRENANRARAVRSIRGMVQRGGCSRKEHGAKKKVVNVTIFYGVGIYIHIFLLPSFLRPSPTSYFLLRPAHWSHRSR